MGREAIGTVGEVHPSVAASFGMSGRIVAGEIDLAELVADRGHWMDQRPSVFPPIIFDLAFSASEDVPAVHVLESARAGAGDFLEHLQLFDVFAGESIGEGRISYAVNFRLRAPDRTLTDAEVGPIRVAIAESVEAATGATLRGEI